MCCCLSRAYYWGPGPQPRHVPWLGIKPVTLCFTGQCSIHWATPARADFGLYQGTYKYSWSASWKFNYNVFMPLVREHLAFPALLFHWIVLCYLFGYLELLGGNIYTYSVLLSSARFLFKRESKLVGSNCSVNCASNKAKHFLPFDYSDFFCGFPVHIFSLFLCSDF